MAEQIASLLKQTYPPYKLVICNDASQDESFAIRVPFPVCPYRNPQRLGISGNFEQAVRLCTGNAIALCDQDDVRQPNKLALFAEMFAMGMNWVCCDAEVSDSSHAF